MSLSPNNNDDNLVGQKEHGKQKAGMIVISLINIIRIIISKEERKQKQAINNHL